MKISRELIQIFSLFLVSLAGVGSAFADEENATDEPTSSLGPKKDVASCAVINGNTFKTEISAGAPGSVPSGTPASTSDGN